MNICKEKIKANAKALEEKVDEIMQTYLSSSMYGRWEGPRQG